MEHEQRLFAREASYEDIELAKPVVLIADDSAHNLDALYDALQHDYSVRVATDGEKALELIASQPPPNLMLLDVMMPGLSGFEVCERVKGNPKLSGIPIVFISALDGATDEAKGLALGASDFIRKPIVPEVLLARVKTQLALSSTQEVLENKVAERTRELNQTRLEVIEKLGMAAGYRQNKSGRHVKRMAHYAQMLALRYTDNSGFSNLMLNASPMHDVGKIGIPDKVLLKPGRLNEDEWEIMKRHPEIGAALIGDSPHPLFRMAREIALCHHEKWDGSGYPNGLKQDSIPLSARIVAIVDVFDALSSARPHKKPWTVDESVEFLYEYRGRHFDPDLVEVFINSLDDIIAIRSEFKDE